MNTVILNFKIVVIFLICNTSIRANSTSEYVDEIDLAGDVQTVTSATRLKQKITDAPVSVTIIDSEMIDASGATEIHELLRLVPGFFSYSVTGNQFGVSNHTRQSDVNTLIEVQVNGRSVYESLFTTVDWLSLGIDVGDIDYIEVIRGSSATTYGSNAFLGAINIITKEALSRPKASIRTRLGNIGRKELTLNKSGDIGNVDYAFSLVHKSNTGFPGLESPQRLREQANDDRNSLNISLQGSYVPNLENEFKFEVGFGKSDVEIPGSLDERGFSDREHTNNFQKLKWLSKSYSVERSLQISHSYLSLSDNLNAGLLSDVFNITPDEVAIFFPGQQDQILAPSLKGSFSQRYDIEFEQKSKAFNMDYVWGLGVRNNRIKSPLLLGSGVKSEDRFRFFGNIDWHVHKKLNTNLGLLTERSQSSEWEFSPRIALNFHPRKNRTIRASVSKGKRIPSVTFQNLETTSRFDDGSIIDVDTISADNLKTETVTAYEIGYIANFPSLNTQFDFKLFREEMKDLIGLQEQSFDDADQLVRVWDNIINTKTQGFELQATHKFKNVFPDLNARLAYAYFDTDGLVINDARTPNIPRKSSPVPRHSATLLLSKKISNGFNVSSVLQYQSDSRNRDVQIKRVDLKVGKKLQLAKSKGKASLVIQNAFNKYNDFSVRNKFKTRAFLQLELDF